MHVGYAGEPGQFGTHPYEKKINDSRQKTLTKDFIEKLLLLFTYPYPSFYPSIFKKTEPVKVREGSVKGSVKG